MITVYTFGGAWGAVDVSPFVFKLLTWLRMTNIPHHATPGDIRKAPKRKLPYVEDDGVLLGDSSLIIEHLVAKGAPAHLPGDDLSPGDAAIAHAFKGMIESELYFVILHSRWADDHGFRTYAPVLRKALADMGLPSLIMPVALRVLRRQMVHQAYCQGMGRHEERVILDKGKAHVDAIAAHLADKPYFMGAEPGTIDATVFAFLDALTSTPLHPALAAQVNSHPNLQGYSARMRARYWSDVTPPA